MENLRTYEEFSPVDPYGEENWQDIEEKTIEGFYSVISRGCDGYQSKLVIANSKEEALELYNEWASTKPYGVYTPDQCEGLEHVHQAKAIQIK